MIDNKCMRRFLHILIGFCFLAGQALAGPCLYCAKDKEPAKIEHRQSNVPSCHSKKTDKQSEQNSNSSSESDAHDCCQFCTAGTPFSITVFSFVVVLNHIPFFYREYMNNYQGVESEPSHPPPISGSA